MRWYARGMRAYWSDCRDIMSGMRMHLSRIALVGCVAALVELGIACNDSSPRLSKGQSTAATTRPAQVAILYSPRVAHFAAGAELRLREIARKSEPPGR